mgnify:CR=1 FL=1
MQAISKDLGALSARAAQGSGDIMVIHARMQAAEKALPGFAEFTARREARLGESQKLGGEWSLFFRAGAGMELEVWAPA